MAMHQSKSRGFSLIELMISILIGMILIAGILSIFFSSKVTYLSNEKTARLQENGRTALDFMSHDLRSSGYHGCARNMNYTPTINTPASVLWSFVFPMQGFESDGVSAYAPALPIALNPAPIPDSDIIVVRTPVRDTRMTRMVTNMANSTANLTVLNTNPAPAAAGQVMMISDCENFSVFQVSSYTPGTPNGTIAHAAGGSNPGNATNDLGTPYAAGARVVALQTVIYYVANDPATGEPGLFRQTGATQPAELIIDGIQALQVAYGEDTNSDHVADNYYSADNVTNWFDVVSVTLAMLVRSEESGTNVDANTYPLLNVGLGGRTLGPYNDRRQRMVFTNTVALRNRVD
jgi:type IV pilus assembly protein PilW